MVNQVAEQVTKKELHAIIRAAEDISDIVHDAEGQGYEISDELSEKWFNATCWIMDLREKYKLKG